MKGIKTFREGSFSYSFLPGVYALAVIRPVIRGNKRKRREKQVKQLTGKITSFTGKNSFRVN